MTRLSISAIVWLTVFVYVVFGLWLGADPHALLAAFGVEETPVGLLTELRAFYGGVELGIAATIIICWWRREFTAALLAGGLPIGGACLMRALGMVQFGVSTTHIAIGASEFMLFLLCLLGMWLVSCADSAEESGS